MDRSMIYRIIYALAAMDERENTLFGGNAELAQEAFERSLAGDAFPELWFELPLTGEPWFDLHVLTSRESLDPNTLSPDRANGMYPGLFERFAGEEGTVQLALSWDVGSRGALSPAVQLLVSTDSQKPTCDFLEAVGRPDTVPAYCSFVERIPDGWFACYAGVFPQRAGHNLRIECIPRKGLKDAYATDIELLEDHLRQAGLTEMNSTLLERCQQMAQTPFQLEYQFDVEPDGTPGTTFSASLRFASPAGSNDYQPFIVDGAAGELMRKVEQWGLADARWKNLANTAFAKRITHGKDAVLLYCYPAFVKMRWKEGIPFDAKAYLIAGISDE